jgi:CysZ protein
MLYFPITTFLLFRYSGAVTRYARDHWLPDFLKREILLALVTISLWVLGLYLGFILFRNVVMLLYSPVLSYLSLKTEEKARPGAVLQMAENGFVKGALRGVLMSVVSLALGIGCLFLCWGLLIIPVVGQVAIAVVLPLSQMFLAGQGFVDPVLERRGFGVRGSFRFCWKHRYRVLGCGAGFVAFATIPLAGWFLGPTLGIVAGTLAGLDRLDSESPAVRSIG